MYLHEMKENLKLRAEVLRRQKEALKHEQKYGDIAKALLQQRYLAASRRFWREQHVAYCLKRGIPYEHIEPKTHDNNKLDQKKVKKILKYLEFNPKKNKTLVSK